MISTSCAKEPPAPITGSSEPDYIAPSIVETAAHPHEMVDRMHSLLDGLNASVAPSDVMRAVELRNILNHLGATRSVADLTARGEWPIAYGCML